MAPVYRILALLGALVLPRAALAQPTLSAYKLGSGDVITIRVLGEDDLRREKERVSDGGTISFPILGELRVKGLTVGEVDDLITKGLKGRYLVDPQVTVVLEEYRNFFVNGYVERPGGYPFVPGLTVRKAITIAGGFRERAARDKLNIIRDDDPTQTARKVVAERELVNIPLVELFPGMDVIAVDWLASRTTRPTAAELAAPFVVDGKTYMVNKYWGSGVKEGVTFGVEEEFVPICKLSEDGQRFQRYAMAQGILGGLTGEHRIKSCP